MKRGGLNIIRIIILILMTLATLATLATSPVTAKATLYIIANADVPATKLTKSEINRIFLLKRTFWKNGKPIIAVNREASSRVRTRFSNVVLGRSPRSLSGYWNKMQFKGYMPPVIQESDAAMVAFVQRVPGAIGYIYTDRILDKVKILGRFK